MSRCTGLRYRREEENHFTPELFIGARSLKKAYTANRASFFDEP